MFYLVCHQCTHIFIFNIYQQYYTQKELYQPKSLKPILRGECRLNVCFLSACRLVSIGYVPRLRERRRLGRLTRRLCVSFQSADWRSSRRSRDGRTQFFFSIMVALGIDDACARQLDVNLVPKQLYSLRRVLRTHKHNINVKRFVCFRCGFSARI